MHCGTRRVRLLARIATAKTLTAVSRGTLPPRGIVGLIVILDLGHQCSFERDQGYCPFPEKCNLKHTHGMDKIKHERWDAEGNQEILK